MSVQEIKKYDHPVLRQKTKPVEKINEEIRNLVRDMRDTLTSSGGLGLAANQIGVSLSVLVVNLSNELRDKVLKESNIKLQNHYLFLLNPKIIFRKGKVIGEEGCLSFPGIYLKIKRAKRVKLIGTNEKGEVISIDTEGLFARILEHEIDHLEGKVFLDRLPFWKRWKVRRQIRRQSTVNGQ